MDPATNSIEMDPPFNFIIIITIIIITLVITTIIIIIIINNINIERRIHYSIMLNNIIQHNNKNREINML